MASVWQRHFLTRNGQAREEVDLDESSASPQVPIELVTEVKNRYKAWQEKSGESVPSEGALPDPLVPQGVPSTDDEAFEEGSEEPPGPGESALDEGLEQLRAAFDVSGSEEER